MALNCPEASVDPLLLQESVGSDAEVIGLYLRKMGANRSKVSVIDERIHPCPTLAGSLLVH